MMRLLRGNVTPHRVGRRRAYRERRTTLLLRKSAIKILFSPGGRLLFQVAKYISNTMHWPEASQDVNMILDSANNLSHAVHASNDPAEARMKTWLPFGLNQGSSFFGREDEVIMQRRTPTE